MSVFDFARNQVLGPTTSSLFTASSSYLRHCTLSSFPLLSVAFTQQMHSSPLLMRPCTMPAVLSTACFEGRGREADSGAWAGERARCQAQAWRGVVVVAPTCCGQSISTC